MDRCKLTLISYNNSFWSSAFYISANPDNHCPTYTRMHLVHTCPRHIDCPCYSWPPGPYLYSHNSSPSQRAYSRFAHWDNRRLTYIHTCPVRTCLRHIDYPWYNSPPGPYSYSHNSSPSQRAYSRFAHWDNRRLTYIHTCPVRTCLRHIDYPW